MATLTVSSVRGLDCRDATLNTLLAARLQANHGRGSVVVDYLRLGGVPHCRPREIGDWCTKHTCPTIPETRVCIPITVPTTNPHPVQDLYQAINALQGRVVTSSAPDEYVLVRLVATSEECDQLGGAFDTRRLAGCLYSCPVLLSADGDVLLDLDPTDINCESTVDVCATLDELGPASAGDAASP